MKTIYTVDIVRYLYTLISPYVHPLFRFQSVIILYLLDSNLFECPVENAMKLQGGCDISADRAQTFKRKSR